MLDDGEECDDGPGNSDDAACTSMCLTASCGDGLVYAGVEDCDAQGETAECNDDCSTAACGDGKLNVSANEICDGDVGMQSSTPASRPGPCPTPRPTRSKPGARKEATTTSATTATGRA